MPSRSNTTLVSHFDCPGGGQVWVEGTTLYVGHMRRPSGTTHRRRRRSAPSAPARDHRRAGGLAFAQGAGGERHHDRQSREVRPGRRRRVRRRARHLRRVAAERAEADHQMADRRRRRASLRFRRPLRLHLADRRGLCRQHRDDPRSRRSGQARSRSGAGGFPGQWKAGGEHYPWDNWVSPRCHHPLRLGDRLYVSYWHHGLFILDISDMSKPKVVSHTNTSPAFPHPTHTCLPMPQQLQGPRHHGGGGRGRGEAVAGGAVLHLDLRHHQSSSCRSRSRPSRCPGSTSTAARSRR